MLYLLAIKTFAGKVMGFLKGLPWQIYAVAIAAGFIWWYGGMQYDRGYDKRTDEYAEIARQAAVKAEKGNQAASVAVEAAKGAVEAENDAARKAAEGSDDPLKSAMDVLN